jgi:CRP-like cAMP-binding protein
MDNNSNIYERLLELPLFQGMSMADLTTAVGQTPFGFHKYDAGVQIIAEGDACNHLLFQLKGELEVSAMADDHGYEFIEQMKAPDILQPECFFGLTQRYTRGFRATTPCSFLALGKHEVNQLADIYIFRLNLLNILSTQSQKHQRRLWHPAAGSLQKRIISFVESHCLRPAGPKTLKIKMTRLAEELNDSRLEISRTLNNMQAEGLIQLRRGVIFIPAMEKLIM